ncbi:hypothetical protein [Mesobacterium pallidum]|uniref:hypothetical protein n=1 Tax=Mesobacterium pallidum TaxID=2872037 RepID=UPI001EE34667|nr:hypothetical protein [Mesobacterium pallidum]
MPQTKIATCNYCGLRAALVLRGETRHELSCQGCGAPLHDLKSLPSERVERHRDDIRHPARHGTPAPHGYHGTQGKPNRPKKQKKRKSFGRWFLEEAFDAIEDIFD